ncbi:DedA family protein [Halalkalibacter sp. APA_J-10(15)]|uniref:DedA family protein n=1 Tax=unclassified Halalkalibacter TaxID=2893063 RepID=UPI001FF4E405|nr:DedA family protein [Halalkalibacter sp. APA_J-10(15)]MCK0471956.1 DedA family protein [Halalkalibacter sp. APA_J-10(15)]
MGEDLDIWITFIRQCGYLALFITLIIGLFLFPVPNEVLLMSTGLLATTTLLSPLPTFAVVFSSILFHGSLLYMIGTKIQKVSTTTPDEKAQSVWRVRANKGKVLLDRYGLKAASFSYFFPFIRHAVPLGMGMSKVKYRWFAIVSFSSALIWQSCYFLIGFYFGRTITDWTTFVYTVIIALASILFIVIVIRFGKYRFRKKSQSPS